MLYIVFVIHGLCLLGYLPTLSKSFSALLFEMPLIFYISGASLHFSPPGRLAQVCRSRLLRVYLPYLIWAIVTIPLLYLKGDFGADIINLLSGREAPSLKPPFFSQMWFIWPYFLVSILGVWLYKAYQRWHTPFLIAYSGTVIVAIFALDHLALNLPMERLGREVLGYSLFYVFGFSYKRFPSFEARKTSRYIYIYALLLALTSAGYILCLTVGDYPWATQLNKFPPNLAFIFFGFIPLIILSYVIHQISIPYSRILDFANRYGMEMFLYQSYSFWGFAVLILPHVEHLPMWSQYLMLCTFIAISLCPASVLASRVGQAIRQRIELYQPKKS